MTTALEGIKELDLSRNLPGPFCTMILGKEILLSLVALSLASSASGWVTEGLFRIDDGIGFSVGFRRT